MNPSESKMLPPPEDRVGASVTSFLVLGILTFAGLLSWAAFGQLDVVSTALGKATPKSQIKSVQHLEGGIVRQILVREGQLVSSGQPLIELEATRRDAEVEELRVRLSSLSLEIMGFEAEAEGRERLDLTQERTAKQSDLLRAVNLFEARRQNHRLEVDSQKALVTQRQQAIRELEARIENSRKHLELLDEQVKLGEELLARNLTTKFKQLQIMRDRSEINGRLEEAREALKGARAALEEAQIRLDQINASYRADARERLEKSDRERSELSQRLRTFADSLERTVLRAPVDGIVKTIQVSTTGGVVKPGETVLDLVPRDDTLIIEAELPSQDIGYVAAGQPAVIRLNSADLTRFGGIDGTVLEVSPDTLVRDDGLPYYRIRIATEDDRFRRGGQVFRLFPGTQVVASIHTGRRSVLEYLLGPFLGRLEGAFQER